METEKLQTLPPPPGIIASLKAGFDAIAANISLILLPLGLDLLLWFGPHLRVNRLFEPLLTSFSQNILAGDLSPEQIKAMRFSVDGLLNLIQDFNLVSVLRTFPIGIFSLMSGVMPSNTPLGTPTNIQIDTDVTFMLWTGLLLFIGWMLGGLFFGWVSNVVSRTDETPKLGTGRAMLQTLLLSLIWITTSFGLGMPFLFLLSLLELINSTLAQGILLIFAMLSMWLLVPFFFMPHGIFVKHQNAFRSIYSSLRMARFTLPTSSLFVLSILLISFGMNSLWSIPDTNSWMALIGITGHAFVTTSLLAASFIYYRDVNVWLQAVLDKLKTTVPAQQA